MKPYKISSFNFSQLPIDRRIDILKDKLEYERRSKKQYNVNSLSNRINKLQQRKIQQQIIEIDYDNIFSVGDVVSLKTFDNILVYGMFQTKNIIEEVDLKYKAYRIGYFWFYFDGRSCGSKRYSLNVDRTKIGYHNIMIPKGVYGTFDKIEEEFLELKDAKNQDNKILMINELCDLIGSIEGFAKTFKITLDDLIKMKDLTKRAFENGVRK